MTGPDHFRASERLLGRTVKELDAEQCALTLAEAQVHATLALAAATAYPAIWEHLGDENNITARAWAAAAAS